MFTLLSLTVTLLLLSSEEIRQQKYNCRVHWGPLHGHESLQQCNQNGDGALTTQNELKRDQPGWALHSTVRHVMHLCHCHLTHWVLTSSCIKYQAYWCSVKEMIAHDWKVQTSLMFSDCPETKLSFCFIYRFLIDKDMQHWGGATLSQMSHLQCPFQDKQ